jgi:hypothetical protein
MYPDVHSLGRELVTIREVWIPTKGTQTPRRLTFFSLSLLHEVGAQSLVVDLRVVSKPSQTFHRANHKPKAYRRPWLPRVSHEPKSNKQYSMNTRGNEIWLGGNVDRGLLYLSTKGIWVWMGVSGASHPVGNPKRKVWWAQRQVSLDCETKV